VATRSATTTWPDWWKPAADRRPRGRRSRLPLRLRDQPRRRHSTTLLVWTGEHGLPDDTFIVAPARHQIVFRVLGRAEGRRRDFESNREKGRPQAPDETYADYLGVSVFLDPELAMENAVRWPKHVAGVLLPQNEGFSIARTYPEILGHCTIWGDPDILLTNVERVDTYPEPGTLEGDDVRDGLCRERRCSRDVCIA
jgi:hypothetical protein